MMTVLVLSISPGSIEATITMFNKTATINLLKIKQVTR